jgi:hypothetical protein
MPLKHSKISPSKPDPNRISTRPRNADSHPGLAHTRSSTRRPESIIQAEKAEKAAKRAKKDQQRVKQVETAEAIAEYEQDMVINDAIEDTQFPRHRGMSYSDLPYMYRPEFLFNSIADRLVKQPNAASAGQGASGRKRKKDDSKQSLGVVDNGPEVDSGVEEQPKSKRTRVGIVPADTPHHSGKAYN